LEAMQRNAALWITGAFRTSPAGGVESLAGLPPIRFHIRKLTQRANVKSKTLLPSHPTRTLLQSHAGPASLACLRTMPQPLRDKLKSPVKDINSAYADVAESFEAFHQEAAPGSRLRDLFPDQISYSLAPWPKDEEGRGECIRRINQLRTGALATPGSFVVVGDGSAAEERQAVAACNVNALGVPPWDRRLVLGKATSTCAELLALAMGVQHAANSQGCHSILVFTDSVGAANLLLDAEPHSGQAHSIATCRLLRNWLSASPDHRISFHYVSSKASWGPHKEAHDAATSLKVPMGAAPRATLQWLRQQTVRSMVDAWISKFALPSYRGYQFLRLTLNGKDLQPTHLHRGPWLKYLWMEGADNPDVARFVRATLNHGPFGAYRRRFGFTDDPSCPCGHPLQDRLHILHQCAHYHREADPTQRLHLKTFIRFIQENPLAFSFAALPQEG
jgi:hypothetical protein